MKTLRNILVIVFLVIVVFGSVVRGADEVYSFEDLIPGVGTIGVHRQHVQMDTNPYDNLMVRDPDTGVDTIIDGIGTWHFGGYKKVPEGYMFGLSLMDKYSSYGSPFVGWLTGYVYDSVFSAGEKIDGFWVIYDPDGGRFGLISGATFTRDLNTTIYFTEDIEFDGVQGDPNLFGEFDYIGTAEVPHVVINPIPGYNMYDLMDLAYYWLRDCNESNNYCDGLDFVEDGIVNFHDFAVLANEWNPDNTPIPPAE